MRRTLFMMTALLMAAPASAQQYWLPNGPGGTTYNNPQGSLLGTMNEHMLQRHADQLRWQRQRQGTANAATNAGSADPSFRVTNSGGRVVREVYVSAATESAWGADRLGQGVLRPGERLTVVLPRGQCVNDVRIVFMDGQSQERRQVDTCALTDMAFR